MFIVRDAEILLEDERSYVAAGEVAALEHELGDDTVELGARVAEPLLASAESAEVLGGLGDNIIEELEVDAAGAGCGRIRVSIAALDGISSLRRWSFSRYEVVIWLTLWAVVLAGDLTRLIALVLGTGPGDVKVDFDNHVGGGCVKGTVKSWVAGGGIEDRGSAANGVEEVVGLFKHFQ
jgi:hypothetical protein